VFSFDIKNNTNLQVSSSRMTINIEVDVPRGRSVSSSANSSRSALVLSNVSYKAYVDRIQELSNSPAWAEQVENEVFQPTSLSYAIRENVSTNLTPNIELNRAPIEAASNNTCSTQGLEPSIIPYTANQPADSQLWDGNFCPISIFRINEYLEGDARNINCSLHRIAAFIRQKKLEDKSAKDIPQIAEFGFVAWSFHSPYMNQVGTSLKKTRLRSFSINMFSYSSTGNCLLVLVRKKKTKARKSWPTSQKSLYLSTQNLINLF